MGICIFTKRGCDQHTFRVFVLIELELHTFLQFGYLSTSVLIIIAQNIRILQFVLLKVLHSIHSSDLLLMFDVVCKLIEACVIS